MTETSDPTTGPAPGDRAERRAARLDDPRFDGVRNRPARRRLVVALVALLGVETGLFLAFGAVEPVAGLVAVAVALVVLMSAFVLLLGALKASTRGVEELPPAVLDEREAQVRGEVYARSYRIGMVLLAALLAGTVVWAATGLPVGVGLRTAVTVVTFHVALVLPTLVAAWLAD